LGDFCILTDFKAPKKIAVIDDDEVMRNLILNYFEKLGVGQIDLYEDGAQAWEGLNEEQYDFVVLDWKLPSISGLTIFNRLRQHASYKQVPIMVVSGFLEKGDFRLLGEFTCTALLEKPFGQAKFSEIVTSLQNECAWNSKNNSVINSLKSTIKDNPKKASNSIKKLLKEAPNPVPLGVMAARKFDNLGQTEIAVEILNGILKSSKDCISAINELAKIYLRKKEYDKAVATFHKANKLSPSNIERICLMGEAELNLKDSKAAKGYFNQALEIDCDNVVAKSGVIISKNLADAIESPNGIGLLHSFASILNTIGIGMVKRGNYAEGIEQYEAAVPFLHSKHDSARLAFNLGLGYLRWGQTDNALTWFKRSTKIGGKKFKRSANFVEKLTELALVQKCFLAEEEENAAFEAKLNQGAETKKQPKENSGSAIEERNNVGKNTIGKPPNNNESEKKNVIDLLDVTKSTSESAADDPEEWSNFDLEDTKVAV